MNNVHPNYEADINFMNNFHHNYENNIICNNDQEYHIDRFNRIIIIKTVLMVFVTLFTTKITIPILQIIVRLTEFR